MSQLKDLIKNEQNRRAARQKNAGMEPMFFTEKGGQGKTISVMPGQDMSLEGQLSRLGLEVMDGHRRLTAMLNASKVAFVSCDGKSLRLSLSDLGILTCEEMPNTNPTLQTAWVRKV